MQPAELDSNGNQKQAQEHNELGKQSVANGDYQAGLESFFSAIDTDRGFAPAYINVAAVCLEIGDHEHAVIYAAKALELAPLERNIFMTCGRILAHSGHTDKARELYETYLLQFPGDHEIAQHLAELGTS